MTISLWGPEHESFYRFIQPSQREFSVGMKSGLGPIIQPAGALHSSLLSHNIWPRLLCLTFALARYRRTGIKKERYISVHYRHTTPYSKRSPLFCGLFFRRLYFKVIYCQLTLHSGRREIPRRHSFFSWRRKSCRDRRCSFFNGLILAWNVGNIQIPVLKSCSAGEGFFFCSCSFGFKVAIEMGHDFRFRKSIFKNIDTQPHCFLRKKDFIYRCRSIKSH